MSTIPVEIGVGPDDVYNAAIDLLAAANEACLQALGGAFERAYISPGAPIVDCEQLTVHANGIGLGQTLPLQPPLQPFLREGANRAVRIVSYVITTARCVPVVGNVGPKLPDPANMSSAAAILNSDLWAIWNHLAYLQRTNQLFPQNTTRVMNFNSAVPLQTAGGFGGWTVNLDLELPGYSETGT